jgi:hypothetical protein
MAVRMELSRILIRELNDLQVIELREVMPESTTPDAQQARSFPIVIGLPEAQAIERRIKGVQGKRPQTHDLLARVIEDLGGTLRSVTIGDLNEGTFFATLDISTQHAGPLTIDARPSDAIALAVAGDVPIFVAEKVLESALKDEAPEV